MKSRLWVCLAVCLVIPGLLFTVSCAKKVKSDAATEMSEEEKARLAAEKAQREKELMEEQLREAAAREAAEKARSEFLNEHVYFAFDSSTLDGGAQMVLKNKAEWLQSNEGVSILIEGHCDERGTVEYNLALGDRRAQASKEYLLNLGVDAARMATVSYGEERPLDMGHDEEAWAKNRRAQFVIE